MTLPKILTGLIAFINSYIGLRFFLNVIHVLQTSKYSKTATAIFAILFLSMGLVGLYFSFIKSDNKMAFWIGIGPWALALVVLLFNMLTGDYK
ncbi:MAG: hypothetical protein ABI675_00235 [Chitinophagaceae bacterium]